MRYPIRALTYEALADAARPSVAGQPEAYAATLYDTQTFVDNTTTTLRFFGAVQTSEQLGNLEQASQLPAGNWFAIEYIRIDAWTALAVSTAAGGVVGDLDDLARIFLTGRPSLKLTYNSKPYGPYPASQALASSGGISTFAIGTFTAEEQVQFAQADPQASGIFVGGSIVLMPLTAFFVDVTWAAAVDVTADWRIRVNLIGTRYRPVV